MLNRVGVGCVCGVAAEKPGWEHSTGFGHHVDDVGADVVGVGGAYPFDAALVVEGDGVAGVFFGECSGACGVVAGGCRWGVGGVPDEGDAWVKCVGELWGGGEQLGACQALDCGGGGVVDDDELGVGQSGGLPVTESSGDGVVGGWGECAVGAGNPLFEWCGVGVSWGEAVVLASDLFIQVCHGGALVAA